MDCFPLLDPMAGNPYHGRSMQQLKCLMHGSLFFRYDDSFSSTFTSLGFVIFVIFAILVAVCVCIRLAKRRAQYAGQIISPPNVTVFTQQQQAHGPGMVQAGPYVVRTAYQQHPIGVQNTAPYPPAQTWMPASAPMAHDPNHPFSGMQQPGTPYPPEPEPFERPPPSYEDVMGPTGPGSSAGAQGQSSQSFK